jgi:hypothetical protein
VITGNFALGGQAGAGGTDGQGIGGGVYITVIPGTNTPGADVVLTGTTVKKNHASTSNDDIFP